MYLALKTLTITNLFNVLAKKIKYVQLYNFKCYKNCNLKTFLKII